MSGASILKMDDKRSADRQKALDSALAQIERQFGKGSIMKLGADNPVAEIEATSTGSLGLDIALGIGGLPKGRIIEIFGPESSGKTTLTLHVVAEEQKKGGVCAFVDAEHALDPQYARKLGVNLDELLISQPDTGEQALEIVDTLVRSGAVSLVVVDSVAALTPKSEIEGDMGDMQMGSQARLMSQAMRKLTASIGRSNCMVIFINQIRMKIGVMFGSPETTTGGNALKFYASVRLDIRRTGAIKEGDEVVGNETHKGDLLTYLPLDPYFVALQPKQEPLEKRVTEQGEEGGDLFGASAPELALVGTSYSANPKWNFLGALRQSLSTDLYNYAEDGHGPLVPMLRLLAKGEEETRDIKLVLWEVPERYLAMPSDLAEFDPQWLAQLQGTPEQTERLALKGAAKPVAAQ